jgi:hypothetical protein
MLGNSVRFMLFSILLALPAAAADQSVVLLRNGQVIEGRAVPAGDYYQVYMPDGDLRLKAAEVEAVCRDMEEGYRRKQAALRPGSVEDHLQLAQWCQRYGLLGCAAKELSAAMDLDPRHPMIGVLQRRLKAAAEKPEALPPHAEPTKKVPTADELDRMVRAMPPGTVEAFAQVVQPILMNHCMTGGCHGTQSGRQLELMRAPFGQPPSRRVTQRNLHAALEWVDRSSPGASKLLSAAQGPHGPAKAPVFSDRQAIQYRALLIWVYAVAQQSPPDGVPEFFAESAKSAGSEGSQEGETPRVLPLKPPRARPLGKQDRHAKPGDVRAASALESAPEKPKDGKPGSKSARPADPPGDPFDPEAFNRQFAPAAEAVESGAAPMPTPAARALKK